MGWKKTRLFLGSTIAIVLGAIAILSGLSQVTQGVRHVDITASGVVMILGALAYRSAKRRKLGTVQPSRRRWAFEIIAIVIVFLSVILRRNIADDISTRPFSNFLIPLWAVVAYVVANMRKYNQWTS